MNDQANRTRFTPRAIWASIGAIGAMGFARLAQAAGPTQEDVFRSISQNVGSQGENRSAAPFFYLMLGIIGLILVIHFRRKRTTEPGTLNHPGKLMKELSRALGLSKAEVRQLRLLAKQASIDSPIVLLLCPSVLALAMRETTSEKLDKRVLADLGRRLASR
jgi:hypothetical protein